MAYELWDGFDHYNSSSELWDAINGTMSYSSSYARYGAAAGCVSQGLKMSSSGGSQWKQRNLRTGSESTMIFQFAVMFPALPSSGDGPFMQFFDSGTYQCSLRVNSAGQLVLYLGEGPPYGSTVVAQSAPIITAGVWIGLGIEITIGNGTGAITVYLDQPGAYTHELILNATGLVTEASGNSYMTFFRIGDMGGAFNGIQFDDFHCHSASGGAPNSLLTDSRIYTKKPTGAGYATNWTPNGASANWQCVDDSTPDGDTTYNDSATAGAIDAYAVQQIGLTRTPNGIVRRSYIRMDDAGPHTFQNGIRSSTTNALGTAQSTTSSYAWCDGGTCYVDDPATSAPWLAAAADAATMVVNETS